MFFNRLSEAAEGIMVGLDANARYLVLALVKSYGKPVEKRAIHAHAQKLAPKLGLELRFFGEQPFSPELEREIESMVAEGWLKPLFLVGPSYTELYREYFVVTEKGAKKLKEFKKASEIESIVSEYLAEARASAD
jgi:hypothetical protein